MKEEYNSLMENNTWELVPLSSKRKLVKCSGFSRQRGLLMDILQIIRIDL
jgi:hypothetical protein